MITSPCSSTVEHLFRKQEVASSILAGGSTSCWRGSTVEQLICNQQVLGSTPSVSSGISALVGGDIAGIGRWKPATIRSSLMAGRLALDQEIEVRILASEP